MLESLLKNLPDSPGVYEMKNEEGVSIYIGKAKSLKNRVRSYFQNSSSHSMRIQKMVEKVVNIEWTSVSSEWEALVLESNLIKEKKPKFNVLLRDDKNFSYIRVSVRDDFPMITLSRRVIKDGALYFGPKTSASSVRHTIDVLQQILKLRTTPLEISVDSDGNNIVKNAGNTKYPCLNFHLKKCDAPCIGKITKEEYQERVKKAIVFLKGDTLELEHALEKKMKEEAQQGKFELAAKTRDYLFAIQNISKKQLVSAPTDLSADIIGIHSQFSHVFFHVFCIRLGKLINSETFSIPLHQKECSVEDEQEAIKRFFQDYQSYSTQIPEHILVSENTLDSEMWSEYFSQTLGKRIDIEIPQRGDKKKLLDLATKNAEEYAKRHAVSFLKHEDDMDEVLLNLQKKLEIQNLPKRIECYDISHFSGEKTYASMVVFENGVAKTKDYRIFGMKSLQQREINDFASLEEALFRRLSRLPVQQEKGYKWKKVTRKKDLQKIYSETEIPENIPEWWGCFYEEEKQSELLVTSLLYKEELPDGIHFFMSEAFDASLLPFIENILQKNKNKTLFLHTSLSATGLSFEKISSNFWKREKGFAPDSSFSSVPDLIVIDGGKGQLSITNRVLEQFSQHKNITICSLAKEEEEVFVPNTPNPIALHKYSPEGKLLQRIRDEAHRFAITKNRTEREKSAQKSVLDEIKGLGPKTKKQLKEAFGSVSEIRSASDEELLKYVSSGVLKELRKKI